MTAADHANTVRQALHSCDTLCSRSPVCADFTVACAALDALAAQAETAEEEARISEMRRVEGERILAERDAAVHAAEEAKFALRTAEAAMLKDRQDVHAAKQAAEQARNALEEIEDGTTPDRIGRYESLRDWVNKIARAALAGNP